jgi:hypothetical protein
MVVAGHLALVRLVDLQTRAGVVEANLPADRYWDP